MQEHAHERQSQVDVLLISPPIASIARPNMGLSVIKGALNQRGIRSEVWYVNLDFAAEIGVALNEWLAIASPVNLLLGEWVFSSLIRRIAENPADFDRGYAKEIEPRLPYDAACNAAALERARDAATAFVESTAARLVAARPRIVGFTTTFQQTSAALAIARRIKELDPEVVTCMGGANCDEPMGTALAETFSQIDFVFAGESDYTFPDFVAKHLGRPPVRPAAAARLALRFASQPSVTNVVRGDPIVALDELPMPDMDDYFRDLGRQSYRARVRPALVLETSRGCWWGAKHHCTFCGLNANGMAYRSKSADRVLREIAWLSTRHDVYLFEAVDNILNPKHIEGVFDPLAAQGSRVSFFFEVKTNMTHDQLLRSARAGLTYVQPGIESLNDKILELMKKGVTALQNLMFLRSCREIGIVPCWNLLYRFPGETEDCYAEMLEIFRWVDHLDPPMSVSSVRLDRFSPYFERAAEYGYSDVVPFDSYERIFRVPPHTASRLAYFFTAKSERVLPREAMAPIFDALNRWKAKHREPAEPPVLNLLETDGQAVVFDTREHARQRIVRLDEVEARILKEFRRPCIPESVIERIDFPPVEAWRAVERLSELAFLIRVGRRAVSVVCESGWRVHPSNPPYPGGMVAADGAAVNAPPADGVEWRV